MIDPKYNTTLYNHKNIMEDGKPLISNADFKWLTENLTEGNYIDMKSKFSFEPKSEKMIINRLEKRVI